MGKNDCNNRPVRARAHSKLGCAGIDRSLAGFDAQKSDGRGVVSRIHRCVAIDRIRARVFRVGTSPGVPEPAARAQAFSR